MQVTKRATKSWSDIERSWVTETNRGEGEDSGSLTAVIQDTVTSKPTRMRVMYGGRIDGERDSGT